MRPNYFILIVLSLTVLLNNCFVQGQQPPFPPPNNQNPPQDPNQDNNPPDGEDPCDPRVCRLCDVTDDLCFLCQEGYFLRQDFTCDKRMDYEDRGDGYSLAVGIINIIFLVVVYFGWIIISRKNQFRYTNLNNEVPQLSAEVLQVLQQQNIQNSPQLINVGAPSEFDTVSKKSSTNQPQQMFDEKNNVYGKNNKSPVPAYDIDQNNNASPDQTKGYALNQFNVQNDFVPQFQPQNSQQQSNQPKPFVTSDLNGYWLTQAGKFSFKDFSNFHRIKHVIINLIILQRIFSSMFYWAGRRGDDTDKDDRKQLLFVAFLVCMIIYWALSLIPPIVLKIFSYFCCLKQEPNGKCSGVFINVLFFISTIIMTALSTKVILRMSGFEAQVWILLCLAAWLIIIFFDKKSVELAKNRKGGFLEKLIKFRKIDFSS
ncbi:transmembrane protein, putative (macronuclear) [Tetrahymena thermophila SB210]|uniref:Transmembrane protein, putative n=1 Tax=Tetrahymena thermophila (strain SB210) TaxID=312017 RepID=Q22T41_TETTS|nr:transmembrane protein, putative [Tetrahymena thermophila SB210]EAR88597.1 transmembrane protein, putative [Tetrahymena thermophila SB210]|eukprot:XP_001008842.1 transmembrane protein, putative [Tetrahymena thermophila SB210]